MPQSDPYTNRSRNLFPNTVTNFEYEFEFTKAGCAKCNSGEGYTEFIDRQVGGNVYRFDVSKILNAKKTREPVVVPTVFVDRLIEAGGHCPEHALHVSTKHPGVIITLEGLFLIDGNHRAVKCRLLKEDFRAHIFTQKETMHFIHSKKG